jgi:dephospho-CoA kinase
MLKIGLTGGLGCGKTTVAALFIAKDIPVLDADQIARELVEPGQPALERIIAVFGANILTADGQLNRAALRTQIYANAQAKRQLEAILHPLVYQSLTEKAAQLNAPYCLFAIPLLIETQQQAFVDRILVVDCTVEQQYERVRTRDGFDDVTIARILQVQASREQKQAMADDLIDNSASLERLREQVEILHQAYLALSEHHQSKHKTA